MNIPKCRKDTRPEFCSFSGITKNITFLDKITFSAMNEILNIKYTISLL